MTFNPWKYALDQIAHKAYCRTGLKPPAENIVTEIEQAVSDGRVKLGDDPELRKALEIFG